jgi:hypothetical protein
LSNCGYSPWWISCEYCGTPRSIVAPVIVVALGKTFFWFVRSDAIALNRLTLGLALEPTRRKSVKRSWYATAG